MPSPSSPLEYRPTPQLVLIVLFVLLPLIYICGRVVSFVIMALAYSTKCVLWLLIRTIYVDDLVDEEDAKHVGDSNYSQKTDAQPSSREKSSSSAIRNGLSAEASATQTRLRSSRSHKAQSSPDDGAVDDSGAEDQATDENL